MKIGEFIEKKIIKKADLVLIGTILLLGIAMSLYFALGNTSGSQLRISLEGSKYGTYPLDQNKEIVVRRGNKKNVVVIRDGSAKMKSANCFNGDCLHQAAIKQTNQSITCLPHRLVLEVKGGAKSNEDFDAISQ